MKINHLVLAAFVSPVFSVAVGQGPNYNYDNILARDTQNCYSRAPYGCSESGYCWTQCDKDGKGKWCWLARQYGAGDWKKCKIAMDCSPEKNGDAGCGLAQAGKACAACGCGC